MGGHSGIDSADQRVVTRGIWGTGEISDGRVERFRVATWAERAVHPRGPTAVIIAGRGALSSYEALRRFAERTGTPVVCSMGGMGAMPSNHPLYLGMLGHTGDKKANEAIAVAETIFALGTRLDMRQTGTAPDLWKGKRVVMVNSDARELEYARVEVEAECMTVEEWLLVQDA